MIPIGNAMPNAARRRIGSDQMNLSIVPRVAGCSERRNCERDNEHYHRRSGTKKGVRGNCRSRSSSGRVDSVNDTSATLSEKIEPVTNGNRGRHQPSDSQLWGCTQFRSNADGASQTQDAMVPDIAAGVRDKNKI